MSGVSEDLRELERYVDEYYEGNPLTKLPFSLAAWYVMAHGEEVMFAATMREIDGRHEASLHEAAALVDGVINGMKWPLYWVYAECGVGTEIPRRYDADMYSAARELWELGGEYLTFETAFTFASHSLVELRRINQDIVVERDSRRDTQYEAYDRFVDGARSEANPLPDAEGFLRSVSNSVRVYGENFSYALSPSIVSDGMRIYRAAFDRRLRLLGSYQFSQYSIGDFHRVVNVLWTIALIHLQARVTAALKGCVGVGYANSLCIMGRTEIIARIARYAGLNSGVVEAVVEDMTYGSRGIRHPDIALQPLVRLTIDKYAFSPSVVLHGSLERNHIVLMNRIPAERELYTRFSAIRESETRLKIMNVAENLEFQAWYGAVTNWDAETDVDLVLASPQERALLVMELKSFIAPAEPREIRFKSDEIGEGVDQIQRRKHRFENDPASLLSKMGLDGKWSATFVVVSETSIGASHVQSDDVPVVNVDHLCRQLVERRSIGSVSDWLVKREYLPIEGEHYQTVDLVAAIGTVKLHWYGLQMLVDRF